MQLQRVIWQATQIPTSAPRCSFLPVSGSYFHPSLGIALAEGKCVAQGYVSPSRDSPHPATHLNKATEA